MDQSEEYANMYDMAIEIHDMCGIYRDDFYMIKTPSKFQWVPRQEHLQDMVNMSMRDRGVRYNVIMLSAFLSEYLREHIRTRTMEQAWLSIVMMQNYGKKWNGEEWA